jgi:hypothetical protein
VQAIASRDVPTRQNLVRPRSIASSSAKGPLLSESHLAYRE